MEKVLAVPSEFVFPSPIKITESLIRYTNIRADLIGGFDMPSIRRADINLKPLTASLSLQIGRRATVVAIGPPPPNQKNKIVINNTYFDGKIETVSFYQDGLDLTNEKWGFLLTIIAGLNVKAGILISIETPWPTRSGLGGSGSLRAGLISSILEIRHRRFDEPPPTPEYVVEWAHKLDEIYTRDADPNDVLSALVPSGITYWGYNGKFKHLPLSFDFLSKIQKHLTIAYTHELHDSHVQDDIFIRSYLAGHKWELWHELGMNSEIICRALINENMKRIILGLNKQTELLEKLSPGFVSKKHLALWESAKKLGAGFKTLGAGSGGCCLALAPSENTALKLKRLWQEQEVVSVLDVYIVQ